MDENTKETLDAGVDAVDAAEVGFTEFPLAATIYHGAMGAIDLGEAGIDAIYGDKASETEHLKDAGVEGVKAVPGLGMGSKFIGDRKIRARLYGDKYVEPATPESVARDDAEGLEHYHEYEREHPELSTPARDHVDPKDVDALMQIQRMKYESEMNDYAKGGWRDKQGYAKPLDRADFMKATEEAGTLEGFAEAKGYEIAAPFLDMFGAGPKSDDELRQQEEDMRQFHYSK